MDSMTAEHFSPISRDPGSDEIGELTAHFNAMGTRLKQLINDLYVLQLKQKSMELENVRAELKYLQAQIDPHFLFNTLNAILVLSVRNGHTEEGRSSARFPSCCAAWWIPPTTWCPFGRSWISCAWCSRWSASASAISCATNSASPPRPRRAPCR
jgi:hypothetical protein